MGDNPAIGYRAGDQITVQGSRAEKLLKSLLLLCRSAFGKPGIPPGILEGPRERGGFFPGFVNHVVFLGVNR
jgi:hypothetical protein